MFKLAQSEEQHQDVGMQRASGRTGQTLISFSHKISPAVSVGNLEVSISTGRQHGLNEENSGFWRGSRGLKDCSTF